MSLDVYLTEKRTRSETCPHCSKSWEVDLGKEEVYWANITHNLGKMADEAGIYYACWRPEEIGVTKACHLAPLLREGLEKLKADPGRFEKFNASNGWGLYEHFVPWVEKYLEACEENPEAEVRVS